MTEYTREDDYTLLATSKLPTGGALCRYFNFAAEQVVNIFVEKSTKELEKGSVYANYPVSVSVSTALTSQMQIQKFSELDSAQELELMHKILKERGGNPLPLKSSLTGKMEK